MRAWLVLCILASSLMWAEVYPNAESSSPPDSDAAAFELLEKPSPGDRSSLSEQVEAFLQAHIPPASQGRYTVHLADIDPYILKKQCAKPLEMTRQDTRPFPGQTLVQVRCLDGTPWSFYISASVKYWTQSLVASRNLAPGTLLEPEVVNTQEIAISDQGQALVSDLRVVQGMVLKRPILVGQPIKMSDLAQPQLIQRGQTVQIRAQIGQVSISSLGEALSDGRAGAMIMVKNKESGRTVQGQVIGPQMIEVRIHATEVRKLSGEP